MNPQSVPAARAALETLACNLHWSWDVHAAELLATLPGAAPGEHPAVAAAHLDDEAVVDWATTHADELAAAYERLEGIVASVGRPEIAYFSPEFGVAAEVAQYSGGLGILAGDHLKAASDLAVPLMGIGLLYHEGFFRQDIVEGRQRERYETIRPSSIGAIDTNVRVTVDVDGETVVCAVWRQMVGATPLVLLDTDLPENAARSRRITDRLYSGDRRHRLSQELVLGVGGVRALRALGISPGVFHLNEGHACFLLLELLGEHIDAGATLDEAIATVRASTLFTTHTPVPAGIDRFDQKLVRPEMKPWATRLGVTVDEICAWATMPDDGPDEPFNTAALAIHLCDRINGVSQLHAGVSRELFSSLPRAAGIEGITNGVHARTWVDAPLAAYYDDVLGAGWSDGDEAAWSKVDALDATELGRIRHDASVTLVDRVAAATGVELDPDGCIIGFARRFATYKRAALLLRDPEGLEEALAAGAQFVFAGKAHPADAEGKAVLAEIATFAASSAAGGRMVVIPDYDIAVARDLYAGCDVWLNNPIRPHEACGTSGEKAALNGVLNCSILDGWWADWYTDGIGWAIPTSSARNLVERDDDEAEAMLAIIVDEILPLYDAGAPARPDWWEMVRVSLRHLGPKVTASRMVAEYEGRFYSPIRKP